MSQSNFSPPASVASYFRLSGTVTLDRCPVCASAETAPVWLLPQSRLPSGTHLSSPEGRLNGTYLDYMPLLTVPQDIFCFHACGNCQAVFRNPKDEDHEVYKRDESKVRAYRSRGIGPFKGASEVVQRFFPENTKTVLDAGCGAGEILQHLKEQRPDLKLQGWELSRPSVDFINNELGIEARTVDLDLDDLEDFLPAGSVDFIILNEAYEHLRRPTTVLRKLLGLLRPGGRMYFTAQRYGEDTQLQIRVGEPIFINRHTIDWTVEKLGCTLHHLGVDIKFRPVFEKA